MRVVVLFMELAICSYELPLHLSEIHDIKIFIATVTPSLYNSYYLSYLKGT